MIFVGNVKRSPITSNFKGLGPSFEFCCQCPALRDINKEGKQAESPHQFNFRRKRDIIVPPYDLQSRKSCYCLGNPGKNIRFGSFIKDPRYLKFSTASRLWPCIYWTAPLLFAYAMRHVFPWPGPYGHISRFSGMTKTILQETVKGTRRPDRKTEEEMGRQHKRMDRNGVWCPTDR